MEMYGTDLLPKYVKYIVYGDNSDVTIIQEQLHILFT